MHLYLGYISAVSRLYLGCISEQLQAEEQPLSVAAADGYLNALLERSHVDEAVRGSRPHLGYISAAPRALARRRGGATRDRRPPLA